ncbi:sigma-70 family RNA polymerase sigma factor [Croceitalea sp. MTPC9]|uniref:sigma-70 family RNA polymerase sigma factor n=1 Tax=unclassified Croceitalea TaxID=2632280 RepID=UPI002B3FECCD|nr:sigma-70 family RNA polymerase sigma factor [Croceitalea sp. MTPC6]GMN17420.1 sigma-70 family RNA polymerase sigma factor [Croceitalea sp. MTPC9]
MRQLKITRQITNRDSKSLEKYFQEISKIDLITAEEEVELAQRIKAGDQKALDKLVNANLRFVVSAAKQYQNRGLKLSDLINEGNVGLIKAAKRFDETRGFKFISYAVWWIRQSMIQAISNRGKIIRLPQNKIATNIKIYKVYAGLEQKFQRPPNAREIANELDISEDNVKSAMKSSGRSLSLDAPLREGETSTLQNVLQSKDSASPDKGMMQESLSSDIDEVLKTIPERQRDVLRLYYGLGKEQSMSLSEISDIFNLTKERVRQIRERGLRTLRNKSRSEVLMVHL